MLDSAHIEMSSKAGQNIPIFVAIHLQELLPGSSCDAVTLTLSQRPWSCMDELGGRSATASAAHSHFLGYLGLQPDVVSEEVQPLFFRTSAQVPGLSQPTGNLRISFAQLLPIVVREESITVCPDTLLLQVDKLGTD